MEEKPEEIRSLENAIFITLLLARYPAAKVPHLLRRIADEFEQQVQTNPPCPCQVCTNNRFASKSQHN